MGIAVNNNSSGLPANLGDECVFVVDMYGILKVFTKIKTTLVNNPDYFLSILYIQKKSNTYSLFKDELKYLEKRFHSRFSLIIVSLKDELTFESKQLEVIINSSIVKEQHFIVAGEQDFVELVINQLLFLGINKNRIKIQIINKS